MQYAGLFSFVTALQIDARLWRDVLARKPEKPCKYCEFATFLMCKSYVFSLHFRRIYSVSIACLSTQSRPDLGSSDGSFSDVAEDRFRMKKSAPRRMMKSAPKHAWLTNARKPFIFKGLRDCYIFPIRFCNTFATRFPEKVFCNRWNSTGWLWGNATFVNGSMARWPL